MFRECFWEKQEGKHEGSHKSTDSHLLLWKEGSRGTLLGPLLHGLKTMIHPPTFPAFSVLFFFSFILNFQLSLLPAATRTLSTCIPVYAESLQLLSWGWRKYRNLGVYQSTLNTIYRLSAVVYAFILIRDLYLFYSDDIIWCLIALESLELLLWNYGAWVMNPDALLPTGFCHAPEDVSCLFSFRRQCSHPSELIKVERVCDLDLAAGFRRNS